MNAKVNGREEQGSNRQDRQETGHPRRKSGRDPGTNPERRSEGREGHVFMYQETKPPPRTHPTIRNQLSAFGALGT